MVEHFTVTYNGEPLIFKREPDGKGYYFICPGKCCGDNSVHWIDTESGTHHRITSALGEPVTIQGSLGCVCMRKGTKCSWHVHIKNGVAKDA